MKSDETPYVQSDEEWEAALKALSDDELIAYMRRMYDLMANNPDDYPGVTQEVLDEMKARGEAFEIEVRKSKIADREAAIAKARMEQSADRLLRVLPDQKGN